jgi:murein DD-endopeptidase MepM/ murein hydrolase activator NlpD
MTTPYDGKIGLWHWEGDAVGEANISELAQTVHDWAPNADAIWVKTSDGGSWQSRYDSKQSMAISGPADIARWISTLAGFGLEFHAWCVLRGRDLQAEAERVIEACRVPGVKTMILDVEPYEGYWEGSHDDVLRLMGMIRNGIGSDFHLGLGVDPRANHYHEIFPDAWRLYVNSVHPQIYWEEMQRTPRDLLDEAYVVWGGYDLPIIPVLQGNASPGSIREAQDLARSVRGAPGLSYFRLGVIGPIQFPIINAEEVQEEVGPDKVLRRYGHEIIVRPEDSGYSDGVHTGQPEEEVFKEFMCVRGYKVRYKNTEPTQDKVWAQWVPDLPEPGRYEISVYVPSRHATTKNAQYHIHGIKGQASEVKVKLKQKKYNNQWVPLVVYKFDDLPGAGRVNLTDLTGEDNREIAFTAIRWRQVLSEEKVETEEFIATGFDPPVGTASERASEQVWPGYWFDATGFNRYYTFVGGAAYHTGVDLNKNRPHWDADRDAPVYAPADGVVVFSGRLNVWGNIIVIRHDPLPDGTVVWSRLAHVASVRVREGDRVERGQQIANIGNAEGVQPYHLHFDIVKTDVVERNAGHWPGLNRDLVTRNYLDPREFIRSHRP